jgi:hypothetical protein
MKLRTLISMLTAASLLLVSMSPAFARNTPYEPAKDLPTAHPWQDDNQWTDSDDSAVFRVPLGPAVITFTVPVKWIKSLMPKTIRPVTKPEVARAPKPVSLNQKGDIR